MDASATTVATNLCSPTPASSCFETAEHWLESRMAVIVLAVSASLFVTVIDASNHFLYCLVSGMTIDIPQLARFFPIFPTVTYLLILWSIPGRIIKGFQIIDDNLVVIASRSSKEYSLKHVARVVIYEYKGKASLIQLDFQDNPRLMLDSAINMPLFAESLLAAIPGHTMVERKPHLGKRYTDKLVLPWFLLFAGVGITRDILPVPMGELFIIALVLMFALLFVLRLINLSITRTWLSPPL